jgi:hypothetical protein
MTGQTLHAFGAYALECTFWSISPWDRNTLRFLVDHRLGKIPKVLESAL